ncbi:hypothetical protein MP638_001105 [Amoeboaphelidium occidentale]|nr:hypothetical protein MP638_001105 [Amoeboaphelidium occidentale]
MKRLRFKNDSTKQKKKKKEIKKKKDDVIEEQHQPSDNPQWLVAKNIDELLGKPIIISCNDFTLYSDDKNVYFKKTNSEEDEVDDVNFVFSLIRLNSVYFLKNSRDLYFSCNKLKFDSRAMDQSCELELVVEDGDGEGDGGGFSFRLKGGNGSSKEFVGLKKVSDELGVIDLSKESELKYSIKYLQYPITDGDEKIVVESLEQEMEEEEEEVDHYDELLKREKSKSDKHCK